MRYIKFNTTSFPLASVENVSISRLQATILKTEEVTVENVIDAIADLETVSIYQEDELVGVYNGYTDLIATVVRANQAIDNQGTTATTISVELLNHDIQSQINDLSDSVTAVQSSQASIVNDINGKLDAAVIGSTENIGSLSSKVYEIGDTFMGSDGKYYKAITRILTDSTLVVGGNCEETSISDEIK